MKLCDDDGLFDHCRPTHPLHFVHLYMASVNLHMHVHTYIYIYLQSHLNVCLPAAIAEEETIEKKEEGRHYLLSLYICSELMHALQARRKSIRTQNVTRTHAPELSMLWNLTCRNHFQALRYDLYGSFGQHMVPSDRTMTFS